MSIKEWDNLIDKELLISLMEQRPVLWDKTLDKYKDKTASTASWREICVILNKDFEDMEQKQRQEFGKYVIKKWRQIRDAWVRTLKDKKNCKTSGSAVSKIKPYKYHHQMLFLKNIIEPGETHESACAEKTDEVNTTAVNKNNKTNGDDGDEIEHIRNDTQTKSPPTKRRAPTKRLNELDAKMMAYIDHQIKPKNIEPDDRNLLFFKGILPSLAVLNDDEILEFQSGVIKLLQDIKRRKVNPSTNWSSPYTQALG
ncbi:uncharacterized protein LOC134801560 [Cydia splendana]|uniref:uncharacterized protein LOC134801560 n=1 Tax=Cydia splendana TaxID=1100963 RepID=UPI00300C5E57